MIDAYLGGVGACGHAPDPGPSRGRRRHADPLWRVPRDPDGLTRQGSSSTLGAAMLQTDAHRHP
ncbi:MAG: hypothetical protein HYY95_04560 [Candidatus Rokubacteria bacterium]|nr:hypothetical protein [Candidatus Rokubacteria bacterium]